MDCPRVEYKDLKIKIASNLEKNSFKCLDNTVHIDQKPKIVQFFETQKVRHTMMVVGPTGGVKLLVLKILQTQGFTVKEHQ